MSADRDSLVEKVARAIFDADDMVARPDFAWDGAAAESYRRMADVAVTVVARDIAARMSIALAAEVGMETVHEEEEEEL